MGRNPAIFSTAGESVKTAGSSGALRITATKRPFDGGSACHISPVAGWVVSVYKMRNFL